MSDARRVRRGELHRLPPPSSLGSILLWCMLRLLGKVNAPITGEGAGLARVDGVKGAVISCTIDDKAALDINFTPRHTTHAHNRRQGALVLCYLRP